MERRTLFALAAAALVLATAVGWGAALDRVGVNYHTGYSPEQPIAFSHRLHAGDLQMDCQYCHTGAERSRHAGIPPANTCMNCHQFVTAGRDAVRSEDAAAEKEKRVPREVLSPEIQKIWRALGLNDARKPDPVLEPEPVRWARIHDLPDYVWFDHSRHVNGGVECQTCHGPVETMERMRQENSLSMGWCLRCHRDTAALAARQPAEEKNRAGRHVPSQDCSACHF